MRRVFSNGTIHTIDVALDGADWVVVESGVISQVGRGAAPDGELIDLDGRTLLPGFQDAHVHPPIGGLEMLRCDLHGLSTKEQFLKKIRSYARSNPDVPWILGGGWAMADVPDGIALASWLNDVVPDRPVYLESTEGHAAWVNQRALDVAGITAATPDPQLGRIERDANGEPSGTLQEEAMFMVERVTPPNTPSDYEDGIVAAQQHLLRLGVTAWQDAWVLPSTHDAYRNLDRSGRLISTVVGALWWDRNAGTEQLAEHLARSREGSPRYRPTSIKLMVDGVCENGTAAMHNPFVDSGSTGIQFIPTEVLVEVVPLIMAAGIQPHFHAIGDRAIHEALNAVEAGHPADREQSRPHIAHIQVVDPADIGRFAALDVTANAQTLWACHDAMMDTLTAPRLGPTRTNWQYPFKDLLDAGARLACGSDWSVSSANPFEQMAVAVERVGADEAPPFRPDQAIDLDAALHAFTMGSAFVNHDDERAGSISPGKDADLTVASDDPLTTDNLREVTVEQTYVGGELVFG